MPIFPTTASTNPGVMAADSTALLLIGFQNEYFSEAGALHGNIDAGTPKRVLSASVRLIERLAGSETLIVATPIVFTANYDELINPVGVLAAIKARGAFREGTHGARLVDELEPFLPRIVEVKGRRGLNAFSNTVLDESLQARGVRDVLVAGALTCVCVDSTARSAYDRGYRVTIVSDCTMGRTDSEHRLFCERVFPLYADVSTSDEIADRLATPRQMSA